MLILFTLTPPLRRTKINNNYKISKLLITLIFMLIVLMYVYKKKSRPTIKFNISDLVKYLKYRVS